MATLGYALLAHLARRPGTGYDLARALERPLGYFWTARHSQIYPELARLEEAGWLVGKELPGGPGPRARREYRLTEAGSSALRAWLLEPSNPAPVRDEFGLRLYALWLLPRPEARALIEGERALRGQRLALFEDELARIGRPAPGDPAFGGFISAEAGRRYAQMRIEWCDWVLSLLADVP